MENRQRVVRTAPPGSKNPLEILGHFYELSLKAARGRAADVFEAAVELPVRCLGVDKTLLLSYSDHDGFYLPIASRNISDSFLRNCHLLADDYLLGSVITDAGPKVVEDMASLPWSCASTYLAEEVRSLACFPVAGASGVEGILLNMCCSRAPFAVWEVELMYTLANHVAAAMRLSSSDGMAFPLTSDTVQGYEPLMDRLWSEVQLSSGNLKDVLYATLDEALRVLQANSGSIMLSEEGGCHLAASRGLRVAPGQASHTLAGNIVSAKVISGRKPILLQGMVDRSEFPGATSRPELLSAICVPLHGRRRIIGLLNLNRSEGGQAFQEGDLNLATTIARHTAMAVENAKLHEATRDQARYLGDLYRIARTITSTLELTTVLRMITQRIRTLFPSDVCGLLLYDPDMGQTHLASSHGISQADDQAFIDLILHTVMLSHSQRRTTLIPDLLLHPAHAVSAIARRLDLQSAVVVPLTIRQRIVGYIAAYRRKPHGFPRPIVRLLLGMAELAAIAIENARLYERQSAIANIAQKELTPTRLRAIPGFEIGCKHVPACQVGGDYYDLIPLDKHRYAIVVADVSGKSASAAMHIAMCKHSLRALADHVASPAVLLRKMNRLIYDQTDPEAFISMFYAILDTRESTLLHSSAGHEPAVLVRVDPGQVEHLSTRGILLGITRNATFQEQNTSINAGDTLLLYTDGLIDAIASDHDLGLARIAEILKTAHLQNAQELADNIYQLTRAGQPGRSPDDIALIALKKI